MKTQIQDIREEILTKIDKIKEDLLCNKISLLETDLGPIFIDLKNSLSVENIFPYSELYKEVSQLLVQKFEELKRLIVSLGKNNLILQFLEQNPSDEEVLNLLASSWMASYNLHTISYSYLEKCKESLIKDRASHFPLEHPDIIKKTQNFVLEMPKQNFVEKMNKFYESIKKNLPCPYELIFKDEKNQEKLFENFIYLLHLLQSGKLKYQKETNSIYFNK